MNQKFLVQKPDGNRGRNILEIEGSCTFVRLMLPSTTYTRYDWQRVNLPDVGLSASVFDGLPINLLEAGINTPKGITTRFIPYYWRMIRPALVIHRSLVKP